MVSATWKPGPPPAPAGWFTVLDAARLVGVTRETFRGWCLRGRVKTRLDRGHNRGRHGRRHLISRAELKRIQKLRTPPRGYIPTDIAAGLADTDHKYLGVLAARHGIPRWQPFPGERSSPVFYDESAVKLLALTIADRSKGRPQTEAPPGQAEPLFWLAPPPVIVSGVMVDWWCVEELPRRRAMLKPHRKK